MLRKRWFLEKEKQLGLLFLVTVLLASSFNIGLSSLNLLSQNEESEYPYRGADYITEELGNGFWKWTSQPRYVWNGSHWVPYVFLDKYESDGYYEVRTGLVGVKLYDTYSTFYDPNMTEVRVQSEQWFLLHFNSKIGDWRDASLSNLKWTVKSNSSGVFITKTWDTAYSTTTGTLKVDYVFHAGSPLKHQVTWTSNVDEAMEPRFEQYWTGISATLLDTNLGECDVSSNKVLNKTHAWFSFLSDKKELSVFEDQSHAVAFLNYSEADLSTGGKKARFVFAGFNILNVGEKAEIDPSTLTLAPSTSTHKIFDEDGNEVSAGIYTSVQSDDGDRWFCAGGTWETLYIVYWNLTAFNSGGYVCHNVTLRFDGYRQSYNKYVDHRDFGVGAWQNDGSISATADGPGWEFEYTFTEIPEVMNVSNCIWTLFRRAGGQVYGLNTDALQLEVVYEHGYIFRGETIDAVLQKIGSTYGEAGSATPTVTGTGSELYAGQDYYLGDYFIWRLYLSFNTSLIPDVYVENLTGTLYFRTDEDYSDTEFNVTVYSGEWGSTLDSGDWGCGSYLEGHLLNSSDYVDDYYFTLSIFADNINTTGRTQFELNSTKEGSAPTGEEFLYFFSANSAFNKRPCLLVTYDLSNEAPTIGGFQAPAKVYDGQYFMLNCTVQDLDGNTTIVNATIEVSNSIILKYDNTSDIFSEHQDTNNYCTLDAAGSVRTHLNSTTFKLSWRIKLDLACPEGYFSVLATDTKVYDSYNQTGTNSQNNLFYFDKKHILNLRVLDDGDNAFLNVTVKMNNGTEYSKTSSAGGWANYTGITANSVDVAVHFHNIVVNTTTVTMDDNKTLDLACTAYNFTMEAVVYHVASNATITNVSFNSTTSLLEVSFSGAVDTYVMDVDTEIPTYVLNCSYDIDTDYTSFLELTHYANLTITVAYPSWSTTRIHRADHLITATSWTGQKLCVTLSGDSGDSGSLEVYCGTRGSPQDTSLSDAVYSSTTKILAGTYSFSFSSTTTEYVDWTTGDTGTGDGGTTPSTAFLTPLNIEVGNVQQGTSKSFNATVLWTGTLSITLVDVSFNGTGCEWLQTTLELPAVFTRSLSQTEGSAQVPLTLKLPSQAKLGDYKILVEYQVKIGATTYQTTANISWKVISTPIPPGGIPTIISILLILSLVGIAAVSIGKH